MKTVILIIALMYTNAVFCTTKPEHVSLFPDDSAKHPSQCINSWVCFPITPEVLQGYEMSASFVKAREGTEQSDVDVKKSICVAYIYVDTEAGITMYLDSLWKFTREGPTKINSGVGKVFIWKRRVDQAMNYMKVWSLDEEQQKIFHLEPTPKWMNVFLPEKKDAVYLTKVGFFLNSIGDCESATRYLEQAYSMGPVSDKLVFELSFAYNSMKMTDKSIKVLRKALEENPANVMVYRELGYAYLISRKYEQAIGAYMEGIKRCGKNDMATKSEMAINAAQAFYHNGNQEAADRWYNKAVNWAPPGSQIYKMIHRNDK